MINYLLLALGIFTILISIILIFLDKLKGEDIYFNIDVKEQEMKKPFLCLLPALPVIGA